mmetsp:Transcript_6984/g.8800  ORF Transcript_6984/g.8800 Transcript_6984/m.8800 type:complete len:468 (-) Transcript_6984:786-2189(-)|eukprot:CAMPEP_0204843688 /NCGR_PEP_ID=MMETSP1346-20131115/48125_1 /ASSEMBLY_ACC=CAM_ASM_000771 /TAXON_ID=215587 /ORGANISM="Aplanochytrium stocchinoi, Strain GSBS06" /LENGTH=467 /DNA_ID=CAMNT_0051982873 /DNA_START=111 /DNA_END=1514 /DNA_ORIENTATION=+
MKSTFLAIALMAFSAVSAEEVVTLTEANFQETIDNNDYVLVEFYAPWCGHCKALAPEYEKAAAALKDYEPKVVIAKVDATAESELGQQFGVQGFPTLKWFVSGEATEYGGGRDEKTIVSWVKKKTGPAAKTLETSADLESFKASADAVAVGIFKSEDQAAGYLISAQLDDETPFAIAIDNADVEKAAEVEAPAVVVFKTFDEGKSVFDGDLTDKDAISKFVSGSSMPLIIAFSQETAPKIFGGAIKNHVLVFSDSSKEDEFAGLKEKLSGPAKKAQGEFLFVTVDKSEDRVVEFFGIAEADMPTVRLVEMGDQGMKKYKFAADEITDVAISEFLESFKAGSLSQDLKSEEPVPESDQGNVRVLVGKDFDEVVNTPGADVLVEFYAPWCGHCKKLEPEYNSLGEHYKDNDKIIIAKMDATANEVSSVQVSGFPTLKFFPADTEEIVDYEGERDKDGMIKFIEENKKSA